MKLPSFITIIDTAWGWNLADFFLFHQLQIHVKKTQKKWSSTLMTLTWVLFQFNFLKCIFYVARGMYKLFHALLSPYVLWSRRNKQKLKWIKPHFEIEPNNLEIFSKYCDQCSLSAKELDIHIDFVLFENYLCMIMWKS